MICEYLDGTKCKVASTMSGFDIHTTQEACKRCLICANPKVANEVTLSLILYQTKGEIAQQALFSLKQIAKNKIIQGPGTELKKLISWFYSPDKRKCKCLTRIAKMNKWGPDKCEQKMETIIRWLRHSARIHKIPFFRPAVILLIKKAIKNARLQSQHPPEKIALLPIVSLQLKLADGTQ